MTPKVYFYSPKPKDAPLFQKSVEEWTGDGSNFTCWIVRTYLQLKNRGFPCEVIDTIPAEGIVIADRDTLGNAYPYLGETMLICAKCDREFHSSAHIHVVLNPIDLHSKTNLYFWKPYYIPIWSQPSLIPRNRERGNKVKNITYIGTRSNIASELSSESWLEAMQDLDCNWYPTFNPERWADYSEIDAIVAARSFDGNPYHHKPASKLVNCWRAGVPAILAPESAFLGIKQSELDFMTVNSLTQTVEAIKKLKNEPNLYQSMVENGWQRASEFTDTTIVQNWLDFFEQYAFPEYEKWLRLSSWQKRLIFLNRFAKLKLERRQSRLKKRSLPDS
jgi:hypothetical protein